MSFLSGNIYIDEIYTIFKNQVSTPKSSSASNFKLNRTFRPEHFSACTGITIHRLFCRKRYLPSPSLSNMIKKCHFIFSLITILFLRKRKHFNIAFTFRPCSTVILQLSYRTRYVPSHFIEKFL